MFWDKLSRKKQKTGEGEETGQNINKRYVHDYDWIDYYRPQKKKQSHGWGDMSSGNKGSRGFILKVMAAMAILLVLVGVRQVNQPLGEEMKKGLGYILTTDWNVKPVMEQAVKLGLQFAGVDSQVDSGAMKEELAREAVGNAGFVGEMALPVSGRVVRQYGWNKDPLDDMDRFHPGVDIAVKPGTPVKPVLPGKVIKKGTSGQYGNYVVLDHGDGIYSMYAGLGKIPVSKDQETEVDDVLGEVAGTANGGDGVLHFEFRENGSLVDPMKIMTLPTLGP